MRRRVVITGMGCVTPLGHDVESVWSALLNKVSGPSVTEIFDASTFPSTFTAQVKGFELPADLAADPRHKHAGRHTRFALKAAVDAWRMSGVGDSDAFDPDRTGLYLGSGEGSLDFANFTSLLVDGWDGRRLDSVA